MSEQGFRAGRETLLKAKKLCCLRAQFQQCRHGLFMILT